MKKHFGVAALIIGGAVFGTACGSSGGTGGSTGTGTGTTTGKGPTTAAGTTTGTTTSKSTGTGAGTGSTTSTGGGGNDCATLCSLVAQNCMGTMDPYTSNADCMTKCMAYAPGTPGAMSGNTLACRIYHAMAAAGNPTLHCPHTGQTSSTCM